MNAQDFITEKYEDNNWGFYPPGRRLVAEWLDEYAKRYHAEQCNIANVIGRSEQLCGWVPPDSKTSSATRCQRCGREKWEHPEAT
jgi:hypothetical protein